MSKKSANLQLQSALRLQVKSLSRRDQLIQYFDKTVIINNLKTFEDIIIKCNNNFKFKQH